MSTPITSFKQDDQVRSERFGVGRVIVDRGATTIVQFEHGLESVLNAELNKVRSLKEAIESARWDSPARVITRIQAEAIQSLNDMWGIFSQSRIALLPHQLWVCRKVNSTWPTRWLVADDVGLGKTIEAGLILWPLISRGTVRRLLVICPSSLVDQWQERLREMFDIRLSKYLPELDTPRSDYWNAHNQIVASLQTLRIDHDHRQDRLLSAEPWDMVIVDEAHHLNADEKTGPTLGYRLLDQMAAAKRVTSLIFFTGTPHRGKDFGFWSLMSLVRPDMFDPDLPSRGQLPKLREAMIRNNKQDVTDLKGNLLFKKPLVSSNTYSYSPEEKYFYNLLTQFIVTGEAYASSLNAADQRLAMLVLITMQKLASSSVAAIHRAVENRLNRMVEAQKEREYLERQRRILQDQLHEYGEAEDSFDLDKMSQLEDRIAELSFNLNLMADEEPRLRELLAAANKISEETKINKIISVVKEQFPSESVLMFTEYKATQSLMMSKLMQLFGDDTVAFINGDERAEGVVDSKGQVRTIVEDRLSAAARFNSGKARFLISTEAGGEGIDLQENCHNLIHIDLPWNPMRLHQRVGRLNRYGQSGQVNVVQLRNPDTVESHIWDLLNQKISRIMQAFDQVMDDPEDLKELVLGMTSPSVFREVFSEANSVPPSRLNEWFDHKTVTFGGKDVIDAVKEIVGNASRFDYQQVSSQLPQLDLPALEPFIRAMLALNRRRVTRDDDGISFNTPDPWLKMLGVRRSYERLTFDRSNRSGGGVQRVLGVGHKVMNAALFEAKAAEEAVTAVPSTLLEDPIIVFRITDQVSTEAGVVRQVTAGVRLSQVETRVMCLLKDENLLMLLNQLTQRRDFRRTTDAKRPIDFEVVEKAVSTAEEYIANQVSYLDLPFKVPAVFPLAILWPSSESDSEDGSDRA